MTLFPFVQSGDSVNGFQLLLEKAFMSVLSDYTETDPNDVAEVLSELMKTGFRIYDLTSEDDPGHQGVLISKDKGDGIAPVAFVTVPRKLRDGGLAIDIHRFDKANWIDTLEMKPVSSRN